MQQEIKKSIHWSFWLIAIFALLWNGLGFANYLIQMNTEMVATFPDTQKAIIIGRPVWATAGFAIAMLAGTLGSVLLLLRKYVAFYPFVVSLLGVVVTMVHTVNVAKVTAGFGFAEIFVMIIMPIIVALLLIWFTRQSKKKQWIK